MRTAKLLALFAALAVCASAQFTPPSGGGGGSGTVTSITTSCGAVGGTITTTGNIATQELINAQAAGYAVLAGDCGKAVVSSDASAAAYTIAAAGSTGFPAGWFADLRAGGAGTVTLTPTTSTINGNATLVLTTGQSARIISDGTNYTALLGAGAGGGSANPANIVSVSFSATPTFTCTSSSAGTITTFVVGALTGNITGSTLSGCTTGQELDFSLTQDATGGRTISWPTGFSSMPQPSPVASVTTILACIWDGTNCNTKPAQALSGPSVGKLVTAPAGSPPSGSIYCWADSTGLTQRCVDSAGTFFSLEQELTSGSIRKAGGANTADSAATASDILSLCTTCAPTASPTFTGTVTIPTPYTIGAVSVTATGTQLNYLAAAGGTTGTTSTNVVFSTNPTIGTPAITTSATITNNNIGAVSADGAVLTNTTAATASVTQFSPRLHFIGQGWKTNATAASQQTDWFVDNEPVSNSANPTAELHFVNIINAGTAANPVTFCSTATGNGSVSIALGSGNSSTACASATGINARTSNINLVNAGTEIASISPNAITLSNSKSLFFSASANQVTGSSGICLLTSTQLNFNDGSTTCTAAHTTIGVGLAGIYREGTTFTASGCSIGTPVGGATGGKFTLGANNCTVVITMGNSLSAPTGWSCSPQDQTTAALTAGVYESASTATTATFTIPATAGASDVIVFHCDGI